MVGGLADRSRVHLEDMMRLPAPSFRCRYDSRIFCDVPYAKMALISGSPQLIVTEEYVGSDVECLDSPVEKAGTGSSYSARDAIVGRSFGLRSHAVNNFCVGDDKS